MADEHEQDHPSDELTVEPMTPEQQEAFIAEKVANVEKMLDERENPKPAADEPSGADKDKVADEPSGDKKPDVDEPADTGDKYAEIRHLIDEAQEYGMSEEEAIGREEKLVADLERFRAIRAKFEPAPDEEPDDEPDPEPPAKPAPEPEVSEKLLENIEKHLEEGDNEAAIKDISDAIKTLNAKIAQTKETVLTEAQQQFEQERIEDLQMQVRTRFDEYVEDLPKDYHKEFGIPGRKPGSSQQENLKTLFDRFCNECKVTKANMSVRKEKIAFANALKLAKTKVKDTGEAGKTEEDKVAAFFKNLRGKTSPPQDMVSSGRKRSGEKLTLREKANKVREKHGYPTR